MRDLKQDRLKSTKLFATLDRKELDALSEATTELTVKAGTMLAREGHTGHEAFVILEGKVDIIVDGQKVNTLGQDEIVGELALLLHEPRQASLLAATDVRLLVIEPGRFEELLNRIPSMARQLVVSLARRLRDADALLHH